MKKIGIFCVGMMTLIQCSTFFPCHAVVNTDTHNDGSEGEVQAISPAVVSINNELVAAHAQLTGLNGPYPYVFERPGTVCGRAVMVVQKAQVITHSLQVSREKVILQSQILCVAQLVHEHINKAGNFNSNKFRADVVYAFGQNAASFEFICDLVATLLR